MEVVYYSCEKYCPVKNYLAKYLISNKDTKKEINTKERLLSDIDNKIEHIIQNHGNPTPPISSKLREYSYFEIRQRKNKNTLIRIFYFCHQERIVLLNALEKPDNYDKSKEKRKIEKQLKITQEYKDKFEINPTLYEKY